MLTYLHSDGHHIADCEWTSVVCSVAVLFALEQAQQFGRRLHMHPLVLDLLCELIKHSHVDLLLLLPPACSIVEGDDVQ